MQTFFELIRWKNILFMGCILLLMQYAIVVPTLQIYDMGAQCLNPWQVVLMIAGLLLISGGGYAINDYFDVKIDAINKPTTRIVGRLTDRHQAMIIHQITTIIGVVCGIALAIWLKSFTIGLIYIFIPGLLWFYSASYKRQFFIGNIIVAFHTCLSVAMVGIANARILELQYGNLLKETPILRQLYGWIIGYAIFFFLCMLLHEIIKDIKDEKGDREMECHTLPIKLGLKTTKIILYCLIAVICGLLCYTAIDLLPFKSSLSIRYVLFGLLLPFIALVYLLITAKRPSDYRHAATMCQFIMAIGALYSLVYYYLLAKQFGFAIFGLFLVQ